MIKAKSADTSRVAYGGSIYKIYDAYPTKGGASGAARDLRTLQGRIDRDYRTKAVVVDLGKDAGRLRYGVFVARGKRIKKSR